MRILFCNKYSYPFSGTEAYIFEAMELLRSRGHETALFSMADERGAETPYDRHFVPHIDFKKVRGWFYKTAIAARAVYSTDARWRIREMIAEFQPDVAHVRNIYHHLTPSILWELRAQKIPVVYHLNDFKVLCPSYNLVSKGEACEACKGGHFWRALEEKCYPDRGARIALVAEAYAHKWLGTYRKCVDCFLAPSQFVRDKFVEHGWDAAKFEVLPHFQRLELTTAPSEENPPILYFGRLSREKGVDDLLLAMRELPNLRLVVAGDGPERGRLEQIACELKLSNVSFVGSLGRAELGRAIVDSRFTVLPSRAYETLGKTILESYARSRAVIATDMGSRRELVDEGRTGLLYRTGNVNELVQAIKLLSSDATLAGIMGATGRELVRQRHTPEVHYDALVGLYERLRRSKEERFGTRKAALLPRRSFVPWKRVDLPLPFEDSQVAQVSFHKPKLRVAFIGGRGVGSKYSGIETYYEEVGKRLAGMGHEVTAYCRSYFTPPGQQSGGMRLIRLPTLRSKHFETLLHTLLSTAHAVAGRYDVVHYHALGPALFSFIPRLAGKKTVVTVQGLDWKRGKWGKVASAVLRLGERASARLPNQTMVVSRTLQCHYRAGYAVEAAYVPNGGALREWREANQILEWGLEPGKYVLFLGRFSPEKGCHLLIDAYERLHTDVRLVMAGASSYCREYSRQLRERESKRIRILDSVSGDVLDELLTNAAIFVLPSEIEGLSLALLDAMGAGVCVLGSDLPENREAIGDAGFTFQRGDVADLADRLRFLIANPAVREAAGEAAKRRVREHYQWATIAMQIERVYFETMRWKLPPSVPRKPSIRVSDSTVAAERMAG
jgi:glycosyltransferase involved in cell wall biosynthesis